MKKYYYIYKITFLKGRLKGKYYIGKHIGNKSNMINDGYFGSGHMTYNYYKKYPPVVGETITKEILEVCESKEQLAECEKKWIGDLWETDDLCVNMKSGGEGGSGFRSKKTIRKISKSNIGKKRSEETKKKISEAHKGKKRKPFSEERKHKLSLIHKGKKMSDVARIHMSEAHKGKKLSEEHRRKIGISSIGNTASKGYRWINNSIEQKCIKPELLEQYLSEGWQIGMLRKKAA